MGHWARILIRSLSPEAWPSRETQTTDQPEPAALMAYLTKEMRQPTYSIGKLR